jgi:hypothetical protein
MAYYGLLDYGRRRVATSARARVGCDATMVPNPEARPEP